jgi:hypothetical protein
LIGSGNNTLRNAQSSSQCSTHSPEFVSSIIHSAFEIRVRIERPLIEPLPHFSRLGDRELLKLEA